MDRFLVGTSFNIGAPFPLAIAHISKFIPLFTISFISGYSSKMFPKEVAENLFYLIKKGISGCGVLTCNDIFATYQELEAKGVALIKAPTQEVYGKEVLLKDDFRKFFFMATKKQL